VGEVHHSYQRRAIPPLILTSWGVDRCTFMFTITITPLFMRTPLLIWYKDFGPKIATKDIYTGCPNRYQTRHFFNNSNTNEDIATKFEQQHVLFFHISYTMRQVRFKFRCNILISGKIIKEMPGSVASGTPCIILHTTLFLLTFSCIYMCSALDVPTAELSTRFTP